MNIVIEVGFTLLQHLDSDHQANFRMKVKILMKL